jgi:formate-dependent nitrite reductase cytochrome c552 subunit
MGVGSVRMQPYRLQKSKCWGSGDARITCISCHDPHVQVVSDPAVYDSKCFACHLQKTNGKAGAVHRAPACKVGKKDCVTCHMPKVEVPGTYTPFTDHWIRIAREGAPFPD